MVEPLTIEGRTGTIVPIGADGYVDGVRKAEVTELALREKFYRLKKMSELAFVTGVGLSWDRLTHKVGSSKHTSKHHEFYDSSNPLRGSIEVCQSCHRRDHWIDHQQGNNTSKGF